MLRYRRLVYLVDDWSTTSLRMPKVRNKEIYSCLHYLKSQNLSASLTVPTTSALLASWYSRRTALDGCERHVEDFPRSRGVQYCDCGDRLDPVWRGILIPGGRVIEVRANTSFLEGSHH
jgi:hypothetical protein